MPTISRKTPIPQVLEYALHVAFQRAANNPQHYKNMSDGVCFHAAEYASINAVDRYEIADTLNRTLNELGFKIVPKER